MQSLAPRPPKTQHTLADTLAEGMQLAGFTGAEITEALAELPASARAAAAPKVARKVNGIGPRRFLEQLEAHRGPVDAEPDDGERRRRRPEPVDDPWTRRSSRAFLSACERAAKAAGETWTPPPSIPRRIWIGTEAIARTGTTARHALAELPPDYAARLRAAVRLSGKTIAHVTGRLIVAFGWAVYRLSARARRRGYARRVEGIPRGLFACLVRNAATGERYSVARLFGTDTNAGPGAFVVLERAGVFLKLQTPAYRAPARLKGPSGHAFNVYWLPTRAPRALERPPENGPPAPTGAPQASPTPIAGVAPPS